MPEKETGKNTARDLPILARKQRQNPAHSTVMSIPILLSVMGKKDMFKSLGFWRDRATREKSFQLFSSYEKTNCEREVAQLICKKSTHGRYNFFL